MAKKTVRDGEHPFTNRSHISRTLANTATTTLPVGMALEARAWCDGQSAAPPVAAVAQFDLAKGHLLCPASRPRA